MTNISVLLAVKNEACNLGRCLEALRGWADEIVVVDSQSTDGTIQMAESCGARVIQFHYRGGWPKKRQWALDNFQFRNPWILLLDADEIVPPALRDEIDQAIRNQAFDGYAIGLQIVFLGRQLKHGGMTLDKMPLFRKGKGAFEKRLEQQDASMADMEIHEHVVVRGKTGRLKNAIRHENFNALDRYINKHNEYSNWEAGVRLRGEETEMRPSLWGTQAQRRRWLKNKFLQLPGSPLLRFLHCYLFRLGLLDGRAGLIYCTFKAVQVFHTKAKIYESQLAIRRKQPTGLAGSAAEPSKAIQSRYRAA